MRHRLIDKNGTTFTITGEGLVYSIDLGFDDMTAIKLVDGLATTSKTALLAVEQYFVVDIARPANKIVPISRSDAISPSVFIADTTSPSVVSVVLDMNLGNGRLYITFDEPVQARAIDVSRITLQSNYSTSFYSQSHTLTSGVGTRVMTGNGLTQEIILSYTDSAAIKLLTRLAKSLATTYISVLTSTFFDTSAAENTARSISVETAHKASAYTADITNPILQSYDLDMDSGELTLYFSEPVQSSKIDATKITLQQYPLESKGTSRLLTNYSRTYDANGDTIIIVLSDDDRDTIKADEYLCTGTTDTFLVATEYTATDMAGNMVIEI